MQCKVEVAQKGQKLTIGVSQGAEEDSVELSDLLKSLGCFATKGEPNGEVICTTPVDAEESHNLFPANLIKVMAWLMVA